MLGENLDTYSGSPNYSKLLETTLLLLLENFLCVYHAKCFEILLALQRDSTRKTTKILEQSIFRYCYPNEDQRM